MSKTYITLFSSAGVGCYGLKQNGFECIASNELLEARLAVQRANHKCKYDSGYICGDATSPTTHKRILGEIDKWKEHEDFDRVDVVFATPPCQGMSTANYKKTDHEQIRNSLVVQAIKLIREINPRVFIFENVRAFMKSICTDISGEDMTIQESIERNLSDSYNIYWKVINFKDYGVPSSRPRTIVIGTTKDDYMLSPLLLFPSRHREIPLLESIGGLTRLAYCEKDSKDPFHFARPFPEYMLDWIKDLKEGETAFDNPDETKPCTFDKDGNRVINKGAYMGNKYRRLIWNQPGACIATRSDVMSSQDTIHPCDNRVLSIRELMILMTIPESFKWTVYDDELTVETSDIYLKKNECNIRRCIGEAVPTHIVSDIAEKTNEALDHNAIGQAFGFGVRAADYFTKIMALDPDVKSVIVRIENTGDFMSFVPQLISFYSHLDSVEFQLVNLAETDKDEVFKLAKFYQNGIYKFSFGRQEIGWKYDVLIKDAEIVAPNIKKKSANKTAESPQLSLFVD